MSHITRAREAAEERRDQRFMDTPMIGLHDDDNLLEYNSNDDDSCHPKPVSSGTWFLTSKKDPRWNDSGQTNVGGFMMPEECETIIESLKKTLGEPPDDLEWGYMKE